MEHSSEIAMDFMLMVGLKETKFIGCGKQCLWHSHVLRGGHWILRLKVKGIKGG